MRALVARFWAEPYRRARLARWGTELHDRFMLPHFVWQDLGDVVAELNDAGYPFDLAWFAPHFEFRFPLLGDFAASGRRRSSCAWRSSPGTSWARRAAPGGTARYVDSSLERIEVLVRRPGRRSPCDHRATAGALPLQPTGTHGEFVAGVRYRAWHRPSALHPTIGAHAPLVFDLVDTWMQRSLGGCQYHVAHPGGRQLHDLSRQRLRSRGAPPRPLLPHRPHAGNGDPRDRGSEPRLPAHARSAPGTRAVVAFVLSSSNARSTPRRLRGARGALRRAARRTRAAAAALGRVRARARRAQRARGERDALADRAPDPRARHHLQRLCRCARRAPAVAGRSDPARPAGRRVGSDLVGNRAARRVARPCPGRSLRRAGVDEERRDPALGDLRPPRLPRRRARG